jgi:hypothetical protein
MLPFLLVSGFAFTSLLSAAEWHGINPEKRRETV